MNVAPLRSDQGEKGVIGAQKIEVKRDARVLPPCCRGPAHGRPCYQLRRRISSKSNNAGCPLTPKRSRRRPAIPRANREVVAETGGGQTSRVPRLGCG